MRHLWIASLTNSIALRGQGPKPVGLVPSCPGRLCLQLVRLLDEQLAVATGSNSGAGPELCGHCAHPRAQGVRPDRARTRARPAIYKSRLEHVGLQVCTILLCLPATQHGASCVALCWAPELPLFNHIPLTRSALHVAHHAVASICNEIPCPSYRAYVEKTIRKARDRDDWNERRRAIGQYQNLVVSLLLHLAIGTAFTMPAVEIGGRATNAACIPHCQPAKNLVVSTWCFPLRMCCNNAPGSDTMQQSRQACHTAVATHLRTSCMLSHTGYVAQLANG